MGVLHQRFAQAFHGQLQLILLQHVGQPHGLPRSQRDPVVQRAAVVARRRGRPGALAALDGDRVGFRPVGAEEGVAQGVEARGVARRREVVIGPGLVVEVVLDDIVPADRRALIAEAIDGCPTAALRLVEQ